jgi:acyl carrier protein
MPETHFTSEDDVNLRAALKRCSTTTYLAAREFRKTRHADHLPKIVHGVVEHFVERDRREKLWTSSQDLRLSEDLGLDSLSVMEIVILAEEVLCITIDNDELPELHTLGDVLHFVEQKVGFA